MSRKRKPRVDPTRRGRALLVVALAGITLAALLTAWLRARFPAAAGASVLLVTLDTLRADRVGAYGARDARTPHLDALAKSGVLFEQALASTPLTLPSHATMLTGLEPPHHGVRDNGTYVLSESIPTLATLLKAHGYATAAFVGAYVLDRRFGLARGFDHYGDRIERRSEGASVLESERSGEEVVAEAADWLKNQPGAFFAWVHLYDAHAPYSPPAPFRDEFAGQPYEGEVAYVDSCVGRLLAAARARAGERLIVAVLADHGEGLGDHGERTHGFFVYDSTLRIPLMLSGPGFPVAEQRPGPARTADLMPTLLARLGVTPPLRQDGADLLAGSPRRDAYAETLYPRSLGWAPLYSLRSGALKYIEAPRRELYDQTTDPGESRDLAATRPQDVERLGRALAAFRGDDRPAAGAADPAVAERLRSLGYVGAAAPTPNATRPAKDPKDALPLWQRYEEALWSETRGDLAAAATAFAELVAREPGNTAFRRSQAAVLRKLGRTREAAEALADVARLAPNDAVAWHERAVALAADGRIDEAVRSEERAIALNPLLPEPENHRGILEARRGRSAEALRAFERATSLDPNNAQAWSNRANALRSLGRLPEAQEAYRTATRLSPRNPDAWNGLGVLAVQQGNLTEAATLFRRVLELDGGHPDAALNLAVAELRLGQVNEARTRLRDLIQRSNDPEVVRRASSLLRELAP